MSNNVEMLKKLSVGVDDTETINISFEEQEAEFTLRPLTSGELSQLQTMEKKNLNVKVAVNNGKRQVKQDIGDVDLDTGEITENQKKVMYKAIALSLSVNNEKITIDQVKQMKVGLPEIIFEHVRRISNISDNDLILLKSFRKNK